MVDLLKYTFKHRSDPFPVGFGYDIAVNAHWKRKLLLLFTWVMKENTQKLMPIYTRRYNVAADCTLHAKHVAG
jgi:hypothetical protein